MKLRALQKWMMQHAAADRWALRLRNETREDLILADLARITARHANEPISVRHAELQIEGHTWVEFEQENTGGLVAGGDLVNRRPGAKATIPPFPENLINRSNIPPPPPPDACKDTANQALCARVEALEAKVNQLTEFIEQLYHNHHELFDNTTLPPGESTGRHHRPDDDSGAKSHTAAHMGAAGTSWTRAQQRPGAGEHHR